MSGNDGQWRGYDESAWRDQEFGHGQEQYYRGLQVPGEGPGRPEQGPASPGGPGDGRTPSPTEPRPPSGSGGLSAKTVALLTAGVVALVGAGVGGYLLLGRGDGSPAVAGSSSPQTGPSSAPSSATAPTAAASSGTPTPTATTAGFKLVSDTERGGAYEVPNGYMRLGTSGAVGWTNPATEDTMAQISNASWGGAGFCSKPTTVTTNIGFYGTTTDPGMAAPSAFDRFAKAAAVRPDGKSSGDYASPTSTTVTLADGSKAVRTRGTVPSQLKDDPCRKFDTELVVTSFTHPSTGASVTLVASRLLGTPRTASDADFTKILDSIRPA
ncbi:hypothetical protein FB554_0057 [Barrientosiimonas humi]|uniref:DUF8017 domain-containing protein n=1 Tax=Barrientosiimonas humi TaxID=999931 RepID=A0A542X7Z0_9MICO|nr:hypothetical protein [Barrientosiimonas humi]TQL31942.1 hypothetical protein FB554_0057 [Barrientosiimonas humi]CAG7571773.1 hypothetical protein BH39T_PBIAJDOK_00541 [Barrientosiimonas humi]